MMTEHLLDIFADTILLHPFQAFAGESGKQQLARRSLVYASRAQIEKRVFFYLANGGAVRALHIISIDFKLRFGVDLRVIRKQQIAIGLLGIGFLRRIVDDDAPMEHALRVTIRIPL